MTTVSAGVAGGGGMGERWEPNPRCSNTGDSTCGNMGQGIALPCSQPVMNISRTMVL